MLKFEGCGLHNIFLTDGYHERAFEGTVVHSYSDIAGLYGAIARSIATSARMMTGEEFRFLRKRLNLNQLQAGALAGKTAQAVAKWEKGETPLPRVSAYVLRLAWLERYAPEEVLGAVRRFFREFVETPEEEYVFAYADGRWIPVARRWVVSADAMSRTVIATAQLESSGYTTKNVLELGNGELHA